MGVVLLSIALCELESHYTYIVCTVGLCKDRFCDSRVVHEIIRIGVIQEDCRRVISLSFVSGVAGGGED